MSWLLLLTLALPAAPPADDGEPVPVYGDVPFLRDMDEARARSVAEKKPIFAYFTFHG